MYNYSLYHIVNRNILFNAIIIVTGMNKYIIIIITITIVIAIVTRMNKYIIIIIIIITITV